MVIYMKHPIHGTKVATAELEAVADEKNGWVRFDVASVQLIEEKKVRRRRTADETAIGSEIEVPAQLEEVA